MTSYQISRLGAEHARPIVDCFRRVYGDSYANELFYDAAALTEALASGRLGSVGALTGAGTVVAHMAMTVHPQAVFVELGNTVVDPSARGVGLAWQVGAELSAWCRELGYRGFLHYPTTDHHIMQRRSVERGFETGLMLGYIPAETHGKVRSGAAGGRQAATIVYEPYGTSEPMSCFVPERFEGLVRDLAAPTGLERHWQPPGPAPSGDSRIAVIQLVRRGLERMEVASAGADLDRLMENFASRKAPCLQIDFHLTDPAVETGVEVAVARGFAFCGWLPGYRQGDVLRLQRVDEGVTDLAPELTNPVARSLLERFAKKK